MATKDWYQKYSMIEAEGKRLSRQRQQSGPRTKVSKEQFRNDILKLQAERRQNQTA